MRRKYFCTAVLIAGLALTALSSAVAASQDENLAVNPGFEEEAAEPDGFAAGWQCYATAKKQPQLVSTANRSGSMSLQLLPQGEPDGYVAAFQELPAIPGAKYEFAVYVSNSRINPIKKPAHGSLGIEWYNADGVELGRATTETWDHSLSRLRWTRIVLDAEAPAGTDRARFVIHFSDGPTGAGTCYADDVVIEKKD